jgi:type VI secretion system protein ImpL
MRMRVRLWLLTVGTLVLFTLLAWLFGVVAGDALGEGVNRYRWAILGLGVVVTAAVYRFLSQRWKNRIRGEKAAARQDELAATFKSARARLRASSKATEKSLRKLPTLLVLGPRGATKTTVVERSGLDIELLAGEPRRGDDVVPTEVANLWYARDAVIVEAGGSLLDDAEKWEALLSHTQPARWAAAFGLERQAPRLALVCVSCDELLQPGAAETVPALARRIRERLIEAAQALGVRLPVYVLFTRADVLPYYDDFVRSLTREEAAQALGCTLPIAPPGNAPHADVEGARVDRYLGELLHALSLKRREVLARESDPAIMAGVYEFPREVSKLQDHIRRFLVELCRPSPLGSSPFLRAFHFTGVRAVVADDDAAPAQAASPASEPSLGATAVFSAEELRAAAERQARSRRSRRIPDWAFLKPFFQKVVFADENARVTTTSGARVDVVRRGLLTAVAVVGLVWAVGLVVSYRGNRALAHRVEDGVQLVREHDFRPQVFPQVEDLERLDALRAPLADVVEYRRTGRPLGLRWGLYRGDALLEPGLDAWLRAFRASLGRTARQQLYTRLSGLPSEPSQAAEYGRTYGALKAYLILTSHPERSSTAFLPDAVLDAWTEAGGLDDAGDDLLRDQLTFFADVIREDAPYAEPPDEAVVDSARTFLARFESIEQFYPTILETAANYGTEVRLAASVPGATGLMEGEYVVPAHFTIEAWNYLHDLDVEEFFDAESWVLGGQSTISPENRQQLRAQVIARYDAEYADAWQRFLEETRVSAFGTAATASSRLATLSGGNSPLFLAMVTASRNADPLADGIFQPLDTVAPHAPDTPLVGDWNREYADALQGLGMAMDAVSTSPDDPAALQEAQSAAARAEAAVNNLARAFVGRDPDGAGRTAEAITALLNSPIGAARGLVNRIPLQGVNQTGRAFCQDFRATLAGYPFQAGGADLALDNLSAALQPGQSLLSSLEGELQGLVTKVGSRYQRQSGATVRITDDFLTFLSTANQLAESLFNGNGELAVPFQLRPQVTGDLERVTVVYGTLRSSATRTEPEVASLVWPRDSSGGARIEGTLGGRTVTLVDGGSGPWALFRLLGSAQWDEVSPGVYRLTWRIPNQGVVLEADLRLAAGIPLFQPGFLQNLRCPSPLAR